MRLFKLPLIGIICFSSLFTITAQDSLFKAMATESLHLMALDQGQFQGAAWDEIQKRVKASKNVMIGEDHFSNEIPVFIKEIGSIDSFDNFYIEVDPYSTEIIEKTFTEMSVEERHKFNAEYSDLFSFYALRPEYKLLEYMVQSGAHLLGSDQIVMFADRLIFQNLLTKSKNLEAIEIYKSAMEKSKTHLDKFLENPENPMYFMTEAFGDDLTNLEQLSLSELEIKIIADMRRSVDIYKRQSHRTRIKLILHQLMEDYPRWKDSKNLFKYGANHLARGESFLTVFDIGNMVSNITASNYEESFHLMIVGESGEMGAIFRGFPNSPIDIENGFYLEYLKPIFEITEGDQWHTFDLLPLRKAVERNKLTIENQNLLRVIKGYDMLVIIPVVTPAGF